MSQTILLPGDKIPQADSSSKDFGSGVHISNGQAYASLAGPLTEEADTTSIKHIPSNNLHQPKLPYVAAIVLARVTRVTVRQAHVTILAVDDVPCIGEAYGASDAGFAGLIRQQDTRATEKDKVIVAESFMVGDVVRAEVISIGDERNYYLSTARNELGVIMAKSSETGGIMVPVSWKEVVDVKTGARGLRKVARPEL